MPKPSAGRPHRHLNAGRLTLRDYEDRLAKLDRLLWLRAEELRRAGEQDDRNEQRPGPDRPTTGFTLLELLVVILVIAALLALSIPAMTGALGSSTVQSTQAVIDTVAARIISDKGVGGALTLDYVDPADQQLKSGRKWDFNGDGILDGYPEKTFDATTRALAEAAVGGPYRGFYGTFTLDAGDRFIDRDTGHIRDGWGRPLRIDFHASDYGPDGFLVISYGPDGKPDTDDDLSSRPTEEDDR